LTWNWYY